MFIDNSWWPVYACIIASVIIVFSAFYLHHIRDLDSGFLPSKAGKRHASAFLKTPFGFIVHQQRIPIVVWTVFLVLFSAMFSTILSDLETYFADNPFLEKVLPPGSDVQDQFITLWLSLLSLISVIPATMIIMALKKEEMNERIELLLSKPISRVKIMFNYMLLAILTSIVIQTVIALAFWGTGALVLDEHVAASDVFSAAFVYLVAIWVILGLTILLIGIAPKITGIVWLYLLYGFIIMFFADLLEFPDWLNNLSVFEFIPTLPSDDFEFMPVVILLGINLITIMIGFVRYNKRDIE